MVGDRFQMTGPNFSSSGSTCSLLKSLYAWSAFCRNSSLDENIAAISLPAWSMPWYSRLHCAAAGPSNVDCPPLYFFCGIPRRSKKEAFVWRALVLHEMKSEVLAVGGGGMMGSSLGTTAGEVRTTTDEGRI